MLWVITEQSASLAVSMLDKGTCVHAVLMPAEPVLESNLKCCNNKLCTVCEEAVAEKHEACPFCRAFLTTPKQQERKRQQELQAQQQQQLQAQQQQQGSSRAAMRGIFSRHESSPEGWSDDDYTDSEDYSDDYSGGHLTGLLVHFMTPAPPLLVC
jgi:hypothetical protein